MSLLQLLKKFSTESEITHWVKINEGLSKNRKKKKVLGVSEEGGRQIQRREKNLELNFNKYDYKYIKLYIQINKN